MKIVGLTSVRMSQEDGLHMQSHNQSEYTYTDIGRRSARTSISTVNYVNVNDLINDIGFGNY